MLRSQILRRALPTSLFWRAFMILVIPILALQAVVALVFIQRHYDGVTAQMARSVAREINYAIRAVERAPDLAAARAEVAGMTTPFGFEMRLEPPREIAREEVRAFYDLTGSVIAETLRRHVRRPMALDLLAVRKRVLADIETDRGVLAVRIPRGYMNASNPHLLLVWMTVSALVLTAVATLFLRNQVKPIGELASAASAFGRGRHVSFRPRGAEEVRRAGHAFLDMRARIERHIGQRTLMLSGVSHDLRTPLTRIRLALAVSEPGPETEEIARDAAEMERMLDAFLDFVRGEGGEAAEPVDAPALVAGVAEQVWAGRIAVDLDLDPEPGSAEPVTLRPMAIRRCLTNLVENALRHARSRVRVRLRQSLRALDITIEDDGPGIPEAQRAEALRPFTRLDESRNQDAASGVGLGLAIALDIARSHGGVLSLDDSPDLGGLRAALHLPR